MERLAKSCRRLVWLNPLLRYAGFEAQPAGIRAMLPYVDDFLPVHNLESLAQVGAALREAPRAGPANRPARGRRAAAVRWNDPSASRRLTDDGDHPDPPRARRRPTACGRR